VSQPLPTIVPSELAAIDAGGSPLERRLAAALRVAWDNLAETRIALRVMRVLVGEAVGAVGKAEPDSELRYELGAWAARARMIGRTPLRVHLPDTTVRLACARQLLLDAHRPREYLMEAAREVLDLPAADTAARALVRQDLEREMAAASAQATGTPTTTRRAQGEPPP
jgi:hypothetical protein